MWYYEFLFAFSWKFEIGCWIFVKDTLIRKNEYIYYVFMTFFYRFFYKKIILSIFELRCLSKN